MNGRDVRDRLVRVLRAAVSPFVVVGRWLGPAVWLLLGWVGRGLLRLLWPVLRPLAPLGRWLRDAVQGDQPPPRPVTVVAGVGIAAVLVLGGALSVLTASGSSAPVAPYLPVDRVERMQGGVFDDDRDVLFVADEDGTVQAFHAADGGALRWCGEGEVVLGANGAAWDREGRALTADVPNLARHPVRVHDGLVYLDRTTEQVADGPADGSAPEACDA